MDARTIFLLVAVTAVIFICYLAGKDALKRRKYSGELWQYYQKMLQSGDKKAASQAGRNYYAYQRPNGRLTIYDEQAITNDLSTIQEK